MLIRSVIFLAPLAWSTLAAGQGNVYGSSDVYESAPRTAIVEQYKQNLNTIRVYALRQRAIDGGQLNDLHKSQIQLRINNAHRAYQNALWRLEY